MTNPRYVFTSESVSEGHPDKICDRISDEIVDLYLDADANAHVAAEVLTTTDRIVIAGEIKSRQNIDPEKIEQAARQAVRDIGYEQKGFHWETLKLDNFLHAQSPDIAQGVDAGENGEEGAGDQGIMFGYACRETPELMPAPLHYAHQILALLCQSRRKGDLPELGPDAKSQVSVLYEGNKPLRAVNVVVSSQHDAKFSQEDIRRLIKPYVAQALPEGWMCDDESFYVNPTGRFVSGGPDADSGLTGRKIIVDTYGGAAPHGGGAFSGKDPSKVDRSGAYAARWLAKNVVAAGLSDKCTIQLSYAIGIAKPISLYVDLHSTGTVTEAELSRCLREISDLSPRGIRTQLSLQRAIYARTAAYGHFGRASEPDGGFSWERTDLVEKLRQYFRR